MDLTKVEFEKEIKENNLKSIYVIYGEEKYEVERAISKIEKCFGNLEKGVNYLTFDKENIDELEDFITTVSFFGDKKLAIIKNMNFKFNADLIIENADPSMVVVIQEEKIDKRLSEYKKIKKVAYELSFEKMKPEETISYIISTLRMYQINVSKEVAEYLDHRCSNDKNTLINEFKKITSYFEKGKVLTKEDVDLVCAKTMQDKIFELTDYVIKENKPKCLETLEEMYSFKESPIKISIMLYKQFRELYLIKNILLKDKTADVAKEIGMHPYRAKILVKSVQNFSLNKLEHILLEFANYDEKTKKGELDFEIGLKQLICKI